MQGRSKTIRNIDKGGGLRDDTYKIMILIKDFDDIKIEKEKKEEKKKRTLSPRINYIGAVDFQGNVFFSYRSSKIDLSLI